ADKADDLSLADDLAEVRCDAAHVAVGGFETSRMGDFHLLAIASVPTGADDAAVCGGNDRRSGRRCQVHAFVKPDISQDRVETLAEARGQAAMDGQAHARAFLAADTVTIDPDDALAV